MSILIRNLIYNITFVMSTSSVQGTDRLVLVFDYRSLVEAEDIDVINYEAWKEVLDAFGYGDLTFPHFMRSLVMKSPSEVMSALCPYTTRAEWSPVLNKRTTRLNKDISRLCYAEMLPIVGLKDFTIDCAKNALVTSIFLSPFPDDVTRRLLEIAEVSPYIDLVHSYVDREFALLEALEMINIKPDRIPEGIEHRWSDDAKRTVVDEKGNVSLATTGSDEVSRAGGVLNSAQIVVLASDTASCEAAAALGCKVIGVTYNGGYFGEERSETTNFHNNSSEEVTGDNNKNVGGKQSDGKPVVMASSFSAPSSTHSAPPVAVPSIPTSISAATDEYDRSNHEQALLACGAATVIENYKGMRYEYLRYLKAASPTKSNKKQGA